MRKSVFVQRGASVQKPVLREGTKALPRPSQKQTQRQQKSPVIKMFSVVNNKAGTRTEAKRSETKIEAKVDRMTKIIPKKGVIIVIQLAVFLFLTFFTEFEKRKDRR